jgi:ACS family tartrate transporter-like MFS transporter
MALINEAAVMRRVAWRLLPFVGLGYFFNALDRANVAVAALTMNKSLGFTAAEYGLGAGAFFWSYVLFQIPSNVMLTRLGARRWLSTIMLAWGLCSGATALVTGVTSFVVVRFMLGVAEAGYFAGVTYFMTGWFPERFRGRAMGVFLAFSAVAVSLGSPISGTIVGLHGWLGLQGWQWIFLIEAAPSVLLALFGPLILCDRPARARWLSAAEAGWLEDVLAGEQSQREGHVMPILQALRSRRLVLLALAYLGNGFGVYGTVFFVPLIIKDLGFSNLTTSWLAAMPAGLGVVGMILFSRSSDRRGERVWHVVVAMGLGAAGLLLTGVAIGSVPLELIGLCIAGFGVGGNIPVFWTLPTAYLGAATAAAGIAFINSFGNLSGYFAPQLVGLLRDRSGDYGSAMLTVGVITAVSAVLIRLAGVRGPVVPLHRVQA